MESIPCGPSPAVVPFGGEQRGYDLHELCGHVFYERLARYGHSPTGPVHERAVVLEEIPVVPEEAILVVWAGDPAASLCALLDTGTEARYLLVDDLDLRRLEFLTATHTTARSLP